MKKSFFNLIERTTEEVIFKKNDDYIAPKEGTSVVFNYHSDIINRTEKQATIKFTFILFSEETLKNSPFYLSITEKGTFEWNEETDEDTINNLLEVNAPSILLSYMRSTISHLTAYSGYPALIVPLFNFNK